DPNRLCTGSPIIFFSQIRGHPRATLFPYTTLFRSRAELDVPVRGRARHGSASNLNQTRRNQTSRLRRHREAPGIFAARELPHRRSEEHTSELQSRVDLVCRLLLEKKQ